MTVPDDLDYGDALPDGPVRRGAAWLALAVFFTVIFGTALVDTAWPRQPPELMGAERAEQDARRAHASLWDGSRARLAEDDLRDHSRVRATILPYYAWYKYMWLREGTDDVLVGRDHWLFLANRVEPPPRSAEHLGELTANLFSALDRRFAGRGLELVLIPVPRKAWVAREELPPGVEAMLALDDRVIDALLARRVPTADLRPLYRAGAPETVYYRTDTHWSATGAWIAAEAGARAAFPERTEPVLLGEVDVREVPHPPKHNDLIMSLGIDRTPEDFGGFERPTRVRYEVLFPKPIAEWYESGKTGARAALSGTSFGQQQRLARSVAHFSGQPVWDGARPAQPFLATLVKLLRAHRKAPELRRVYVEFPIAPTYYSMRAGQEDSFGGEPGQLFLESAPREVDELSAVPDAWRTVRGAELRPGGGALELARVPAGMLLHDGRGALGFALRGRVEGRPLELELSVGGHRLTAGVPVGEVDAVLPWICAAPDGAGAVLRLRGAQGTLHLEHLALVHEHVGAARALDVRGDATRASAAPAAPTALGRRASLELALGQAGAAPLEVAVFTRTSRAAGPARRVALGDAQPGARVVLDLGDLAGETLERVELTGGGAPASGALLRSARLFGAAE